MEKLDPFHREKILSFLICMVLGGSPLWGAPLHESLPPEVSASGQSELPPDQFGSLLTLNEAIATALQTDARVKRAIARLHKEESLSKGALREFFPKLGTEAFSTFATGEKHFVNYAEAGLEQPLFQGGKILAQRRKHRTIVEREKVQLEETRLEVELAARVLYAEVLREKELTRIAQEEVRELSLEYERVKKLMDREILPRHEFFRTETLLQTAKHALVKHKETYDYLAAVLKEAVGLGEGESLEFESLGDFPELEGDVLTYINASRQNDPVYKLKDLKVEERRFEKRELQAERFPHLALSAKWNRFDDVFVDTNRLMFGIVGKWNIWDFGRLGSKIRAKAHEIEEMKWAGELEVREHERGIRKIFHEARGAREKIRLTEALIREREEIYKNEKTRLIAGEKGTGELIDSFIALEEARIGNLEAITEYRTLLAKLGRMNHFDLSPEGPDSTDRISDFEAEE